VGFLHAEGAGNGVVGGPDGGFEIEGKAQIGVVLGGLGGGVGVPIGKQRRRGLRLLLTAARCREPPLHFGGQFQLRVIVARREKRGKLNELGFAIGCVENPKLLRIE